MAEVTKTVKVLFGCQAPLVNEIHLNLIKVLDVVGCAGWHSLAGGQGHYFRMGRLEMWSLFLFFFFFREEDPKDPIFMGNHTFRVSREDLCYDVVVILVLLWVFAIVTGYLVPGQLQPELGSHYSQ